MTLRLGIDLDGVVCDFPRRANEWLAQRLGVPPIAVNVWDWYKDYGPEGEEAWEELWSDAVPSGFFSTVPAVGDAIEALAELRGKGHQLVFITARPADAATCTVKWLDSRGLEGHHLLLALSSKTKRFTDTDTLLDDKGDTVFRHLQLGKSAVLFKRPWNRDWWAKVPSVSGWAEFVQLIDAVEGGHVESTR